VFDKQSKTMRYIPEDTTNDCTLEFVQKNNQIIVRTISGSCPFGNGVYADGIYTVKNKSNPEYFTDRHDHKIFFSKTPPEKYLE